MVKDDLKWCVIENERKTRIVKPPTSHCIISDENGEHAVASLSLAMVDYLSPRWRFQAHPLIKCNGKLYILPHISIVNGILYMPFESALEVVNYHIRNSSSEVAEDGKIIFTYNRDCDSKIVRTETKESIILELNKSRLTFLVNEAEKYSSYQIKLPVFEEKQDSSIDHIWILKEFKTC